MRVTLLFGIGCAVFAVGCSPPSSPLSPAVEPMRVRTYVPEDGGPTLQRLDVRIAGPFLKVNGVLNEPAPGTFNGGWWLMMRFDTDQNDETPSGPHVNGSDYVVYGPDRLPDGSLSVRRTLDEDGRAWGPQVGVAQFTENGKSFEISIPLGAFEGDETLDWDFILTRDGVLTDSRVGSTAPDHWSPMLENLDVRIAGPFLMVNGRLDERAPVPFNGGWGLQMYLDTDQNDATGVYSRGYDFVVRGPERTSDGSLIVRITTGGGGSGGWGMEVGRARFNESGRSFVIAVPLEILNDEGAMDWMMMTLLGRGSAEYRYGSCAPVNGRYEVPAGDLSP